MDGQTDVVPIIRCVKTNAIDAKLSVISNHVNKSCSLVPKIRCSTNHELQANNGIDAESNAKSNLVPNIRCGPNCETQAKDGRTNAVPNIRCVRNNETDMKSNGISNHVPLPVDV